MILPIDTFHEEFDLDEFSNHSGKSARFYGDNWMQLVVDKNEVAIILLADVPMPSDSISIELYPNSPASIAIITADDWEYDVIIPIDKAISSDKRKIHYSLHIIPISSPVNAYIHTLQGMEKVIKSEMVNAFSDFELDRLNRYINENYERYLKALLDSGEVSNVTPYLLNDDFNPNFVSLTAIKNN